MGNEVKKYEDWGLSLSLKPPITHQNEAVHKRYQELLSSIEKHSQKMQKPKLRWSTAMAMELGVKPRVPVLPLVIDLEELEIPKQSSSSPESTLTSTAIGKRLYGNFDEERDFANDEDKAAATFSGGNSGGGGGGGERKKLRLTKEQIMVLEKAFSEQSTVNTKQKLELAMQVHLRPRQVEVWFQNRRARIKLKQTEAECEQLKRLCESLKEEKRKLQMEVHELRNLQVMSPDHGSMSMSVMHANSHQVPNSTTLTLCPSCKSVFVSTSSSLGEETQTSGKMTVDVFSGLRPIPPTIKRLSTSSVLTITQY